MIRQSFHHRGRMRHGHTTVSTLKKRIIQTQRNIKNPISAVCWVVQHSLQNNAAQAVCKKHERFRRRPTRQIDLSFTVNESASYQLTGLEAREKTLMWSGGPSPSTE